MQELSKQITEKYNLGQIKDFRLIHDGLDNKVYRITVGVSSVYIVRESKRNKKNKNIDFEIKLISFLDKSNFSVPKIILTTGGNPSFNLGARTIIVFQYIKGEILQKGLIELGGKTLGNLHNKTLNLETKFDPIRNVFTELERFTDKNKKKMFRFKGYQVVEKHIKHFVDVARKKIKCGLPHGVIHNDFHIGNLIYMTDKKLLYTIDFDWSCNGPLVKDVALAIGSWSCTDVAKIPPDKETIAKFLIGYNSTAPIHIKYDQDLLFWICFAYLSETATFFADFLESRYPNLNITKVEQCISYRNFKYFFEKYEQFR